MTDHNIVNVSFTESSKAYEALSDLKQANTQQRIGLDAAVILEREPDGHLHFAESQDGRTGEGALTGSLIGAVIGVIGGPFGVLLGMGGGLIGGSILDGKRADRADSLLGRISQDVAPGQTVIAAEVHEVTPEVLDNIVSPLGGSVYRYDAMDVVADLEAAEEAAETARREAERVLREERRAERKKSREERIEAIKARFSRS